MANMFRCKSCGKINTAHNWNKTTLDKCINRKQRRSYAPIENNTNKRLWYTCPDCGVNRYKIDIKEDKIIESDIDLVKLDCEDMCRFCKYESECDHVSISSGPDGPIYSICTDGGLDSYFDYDTYMEYLEEEEE